MSVLKILKKVDSPLLVLINQALFLIGFLKTIPNNFDFNFF
jgi:hypothetical protein